MNEKFGVKRVIKGGVYYLTLDHDKKMRPYVVISDNDGYGLDTVAFEISSNYVDSEYSIPVVINNKISFIHASNTVEIATKLLLDADFAGIISKCSYELAMSAYLNRLNINIYKNDGISKNSLSKYCKELENCHYELRGNPSVKFEAKAFLNNSLCICKKKQEKKNIPNDISKWDLELLKKFRHDMFKYDGDELLDMYNFGNHRNLIHAKRNIKNELKRKKGESNGN